MHFPSLAHTLALSALLAATLAPPTAAAQAARPARAASGTTPSIIPPNHPLVGTWSWTVNGKQCTETLRYLADGTRLGTSGEEVTQADYRVPSLAAASGFHMLVETITNSNGKRDCWGDLHEAVDENVTRFIQFSPKQDLFIVCKTESLQACFGPMKKVPG